MKIGAIVIGRDDGALGVNRSLGRKAGVNLPYLHWRLVHGESIDVGEGTAGVRWIRGLSDLATGLSGIRNGSFSAGVFLGSMRLSMSPAIFAGDDPAPFLTDTPKVAARSWRRRRTAAQITRPIVFSTDGAV